MKISLFSHFGAVVTGEYSSLYFSSTSGSKTALTRGKYISSVLHPGGKAFMLNLANISRTANAYVIIESL